MRRCLALWLCCLSGCTLHERAQNPLPGVFRIAVVPFNDKSNGAVGLDTDRVTAIFASELQKIPSYEVVPLQDVKAVLGQMKIDTNQPALAYAVARAVHAQAVIVGDITEYTPYYPPRIGLHCELYAMVIGEPEAIVQEPPLDRPPPPELLTELEERFESWRDRRKRHRKPKDCKRHGKECQDCRQDSNCPEGQCRCNVPIRQLPGTVADLAASSESLAPPPPDGLGAVAIRGPRPPSIADEGDADGRALPAQRPRDSLRAWVERREALARNPSTADLHNGRVPAHQISVLELTDPVPVIEPWVVRHSRVFDGSNSGFVRKLNNFYFFQNDLRGGVEFGYLERTADFERFACNRMIYEMLEAAGGDWTPLRGLLIPKPWEPWPWR